MSLVAGAVGVAGKEMSVSFKKEREKIFMLFYKGQIFSL